VGTHTLTCRRSIETTHPLLFRPDSFQTLCTRSHFGSFQTFCTRSYSFQTFWTRLYFDSFPTFWTYAVAFLDALAVRQLTYVLVRASHALVHDIRHPRLLVAGATQPRTTSQEGYT
jgi:hypothetical protein